ncbi:2-Hydroxyacid oxidase 1-like [Styela clava]
MSAELIFVEDFKKEAKKKVSPFGWGYYSAGSVGEQTVHENCEAYKRWRFRPRLLRYVSEVDISTTVLGSNIPFPICIAPTAHHAIACAEGEVETAQAAESLGTGMALSIYSNRTMEEVAHQAPKGTKWCHVQIVRNRDLIKHYVKRAEKAGYNGFIVTIDQAVLGNRHHRYPDGTSFAFKQLHPSTNLLESTKHFMPHMNEIRAFLHLTDGTTEWDSLDWLRSITKLPIAVKGILTSEMALKAVEHKVDGIIVSNHGGRQLDGTFASIDSLPEVVKAVNGRCDVYFDGGIRKGTDIAKAIALGAKAVFVGRPILWGLICGGKEGAQRVLEILRDELVTTMQLLGVKSLDELQTTPDLVVHESYLFSKL